MKSFFVIKRYMSASVDSTSAEVFKDLDVNSKIPLWSYDISLAYQISTPEMAYHILEDHVISQKGRQKCYYTIEQIYHDNI